MERIRISGFAGLNETEIDLGRVNLFIGPQASGKSVAAKMLYFIRGFCDAAIDAISQGQSYNLFLDERVRQFDRFFPPAFRSLNGFEIVYELNNSCLSITGGKKIACVIEAPGWSKVYQACGEAYRHAQSGIDRNTLTARMAMAFCFMQEFGTPMPTPQLYIPDGRSDYLTFIEKAILVQKSQYVRDLVDPFMAEFLSVYTWARASLGNSLLDWTEAFEHGGRLFVVGTTLPESQDGRYRV